MRNQRAEELRVEAQVKEAARRLGLLWLKIDQEFSPVRHTETPETVATAYAQWEYRQVALTWYLPVTTLLDDREIFSRAVHELGHALLAPVCEEITDRDQKRLEKHIELATENVSRALESALDTRPFPD